VNRRQVREAVRQSLQSGLAGAGAYLASEAVGGGSAFLAVISAVLVVQGSVDGTYRAAGWRVVATIVGALIGYLSLVLIPAVELTALRIGLVALVVSAVAAFKSGLRYAAVVGAIIALGTGAGPIEQAQSRTLAVLIGAGVGLLAALIVWPESAYARARRRLRAALADCRDLLTAGINKAVGEDAPDLDPLHSSFARNMDGARDAAKAVRWRRRDAARPLRDAVHAVERLWHALIIIDRAVTGERPRLERSPDLHDQVRELQQAACEAIGKLADGDPLDDDALEALEAKAEPARRGAAELARSEPDTHEAVAGAALVFGLGEAVRNLCEVERLLRRA
jgi:uncharacterized membrane protein YgaE (UPF0421/DUF939 family)